MTEVCNPEDMSPHVSNTRAACVDMAGKHAGEECLFGIEQEYTFYDGTSLLAGQITDFRPSRRILLRCRIR